MDLSQYFAVPASGVSRSVALGIGLLSAVPATASAPVLNAAQALRASTLALQTAWAARLHDNAQDVTNRVGADRAADAAWRGLHTALQAAETLTNSPRADAAQVLLRQVFPDGRTFLSLAYTEQWAQAERRLQLIDAENLEPLIATAVGGPEHLAQVRATHQSYGAALNITEAADPSIDVDLSEGVQALRASVRAYLLQVVAWANQDPANLTPGRQALAPLAAARDDWNNRRSGSPTPDASLVTPRTPIPDVA